MIDYADGKAAWLAEGLPADGDVADDERIGSLVDGAGAPPGELLLEPGDPLTVRPNELVRGVVDRLRRRGDDAPATVFVTTAKGRLLGAIDRAALVG